MAESKFGKIFNDLKNKIETLEYSFNSFIPSENELTKFTILRAVPSAAPLPN